MSAIPAAAPASDADTVRIAASVWGLFLAIVLMMAGNGLLVTLLGVRSELEGFPTLVTGAIMAFYYVGFLFGSRFAPVVVAGVGHIRVFSGLASLASAAALIHVAFVNPVSWGAMRLLYGFCQAGLYVVAESWLNDRATNATRGRILSLYMVTLMGGIFSGQLLLSIGDPSGFRMFLLASALVSLAVVPVALAASKTPSFELPPALRVRAVAKAAPLGVFGGLWAGVASGAFFGMGAVYATAVGMRTQRVALFMAVAILGSILFQWPIGAASDRISRRQAIFWVAAAATVAAAVALVVSPPSNALLVVTFGFGGLTFPLYSLCLAHINDRLPSGNAVAISSAFVFLTGLGAISGPLVAAAAIEALGDDGFWWSLIAAHALIAGFALYRMIVRRDVPEVLQRAYAPIPARASAVVALLTRNGRRP